MREIVTAIIIAVLASACAYSGPVEYDYVVYDQDSHDVREVAYRVGQDPLMVTIYDSMADATGLDPDCRDEVLGVELIYADKMIEIRDACAGFLADGCISTTTHQSGARTHTIRVPHYDPDRLAEYDDWIGPLPSENRILYIYMHEMMHAAMFCQGEDDGNVHHQTMRDMNLRELIDTEFPDGYETDSIRHITGQSH